MAETTSPLRRSESFAALAAALAKAQGEIVNADKDNFNPHFKSKYADLAGVWDACRMALSKNGLAVLQPVSADGPVVTVTTLLTHSSGEWIERDLVMTAGQLTPQGIGSCITYARRYALAAMVGVAPQDDDDANIAAQASNGNGNGAKANGKSDQPVPTGFDEWAIDMRSVADEGSKAFYAAFNKSKPELRTYLTTQRNDLWEALKGRAATVVESAS